MRKYRFLLFILLAGLITIIFGTIYVTQQQALRMGANDPQIQIAEDTAAALNNGAKVKDVVNGTVNMANSLAPFVIIYDKSGQIVGGNGDINGQTPTIPLGVLHNADGHEYNSVTWQPQDDIRIASVSVAANKYYVLSGRSLKEVEKREDQQLQLTFLGWVCSVVVILATGFLYSRLSRHISA